jgi:hypothetical protein
MDESPLDLIRVVEAFLRSQDAGRGSGEEVDVDTGRDEGVGASEREDEPA